jgi:hypothetical protein
MIEVVPDGMYDGWTLRRDGMELPVMYPTKDDAIRAAKRETRQGEDWRVNDQADHFVTGGNI